MSFNRSMGWLLDLSIKKKLYLIIGLLVGNVVLIISLGTFALNTLSSIRTAVAGESLWAKAQKTMVHDLSKYVLSRDERAFQSYREALRVPQAYARANDELQKHSPNFSVLDPAFIEGGIHEKDVRGLDNLFLHFRWAPHVETAFQAWGDAQKLVDELSALANNLHEDIGKGRATSAELVQGLRRIDTLNEMITRLEIRFASELGEASRWAAKVFLWIMVGGSLFIGLLSVAIAIYISGAIVGSVAKIAEAASRAAGGDLRARVDVRTQDELGRLGTAFNHMTEGLGKLDGLKNDFFANVSHEFRTPLTLMLGPVEDLLAQGEVPNRPSLEIIHRNSLRLLKLVNTLLDFARLESGRFKASFVATDASAFTSEVASHFSTAVQSAGLNFVVDCESARERLFIDLEAWEKIVFNLLSNALKFTFEGEIALKVEYPVDGMRLTVRDTGTGIPGKEMPHLFDRFHRVKGAQSRSHEGTGIGLSSVREMVRLHGGRIEAQSVEGQGTCFTVHIPYGKTHLPSELIAQTDTLREVKNANCFLEECSTWFRTVQEKTEETPAGPRPRILVVDDNADMRSYIARLLASHWEVEEACDGLEALGKIAHRRPDVVLSDIMMPRMSGLELLRHLRRNASTDGISVILLSARAGEEARAEGIGEGADDYLVKPFSARELVARVNTHLALARVRHNNTQNEAVISRLELEQKWLELTLNLMPIPLLLVEPKTGVVTFANRAADQLAGGEFPKEVSAEDYTRVYHLIDEAGHAIPLNQYPTFRASRGEVVRGLRVVWDSLTGKHSLVVNADMLDAAHGHPPTILMSFQDVTELSKSIRVRDEFLSIASHELRTPITSMRMQLQLAERIPSAERMEKLLHIFGLQTNRLTSLVEDLLDVSRIQAGSLSISPEPCNLSDVLKISAERLAVNFQNAKCPVELNIPDGVTGVWDRRRIEQVFTNLMTNAIKYAPGRCMRISLSQKEGFVQIRFHDSGPGIAQEKQNQIFERFERAVSARNVSGLGLGLFIAKKIVSAHGGSIDVESEVGKGSAFTVTLPRLSAEGSNGVSVGEPVVWGTASAQWQ